MRVAGYSMRVGRGRLYHIDCRGLQGSVMAARTGREYLKGLQDQERDVWLHGERVKDVTTHPALASGARAIAALYDMQHDAALRDAMTYTSPSSGNPVGLSFIIPRTREELEQRRVMMLHWARSWPWRTRRMSITCMS